MCRFCTAGTTSPAEGQGHSTFDSEEHVPRGCNMNWVFWQSEGLPGSECFERLIQQKFLESLWKNCHVLTVAWGYSSSWDQRSKPPFSIWKANWSWLNELEMWYWWQFWKALSDLRWLSKIQIPNTSVTSHIGQNQHASELLSGLISSFSCKKCHYLISKYPCRIPSSCAKRKHGAIVLLCDAHCWQGSVPGKAVACTVISCTGWYHRPSNCTNYYLSLESGNRGQVQRSWGNLHK